MIVVTVELHSAITGEVSELARVHVINDGTGTPNLGNYIVRSFGKRRRKMRERAVLGYPRKRYHVLRLIRLAMERLGH